MNLQNEVNEKRPAQPCSEECRRRWVEAVEQLAENQTLKQRIDFLERQIATNAFGGWQYH